MENKQNGRTEPQTIQTEGQMTRPFEITKYRKTKETVNEMNMNNKTTLRTKKYIL